MHLHSLSLVNFKNYPAAELMFSSGVNAFTGNNGEGKTNLLDAVHYLALCKSYFNPSDVQNIRQGEDFFVVQGNFELNNVPEMVSCGFKRGQKKVLKRNQKEYERLADHIGMIPVVMISPTDSTLITDGSEERRKFLDSIISQFNPHYLDDLINYGRVLSQRNAYLKQAFQSRRFDIDSLSIWDEQLIPLGNRIFDVRKEFVEAMLPIFRHYYNFISGGKEEVEIRYDSYLVDDTFSVQLANALEKDRIMQYTTVGTHKDDLLFMIGGFPAKRFASQGQQKSFLVALKLAQFDYMAKQKGMKPILLLDDIYDKLDDKRISRLMELVSKHNFGQIFITDTHTERVLEIFDRIQVDIKCFFLQGGNIEVCKDVHHPSYAAENSNPS
ncbi:MAG: DNA replication/repair protein RecF [Bacteroidetes bacterium]|nr:DNA replication/repair protein RecF [Bacteroidota bacterium]